MFLYHQLGQLVSDSACERKDPGSNPAADMVDAARNTAWDLGKQPNNYRSNYPTQEWARRSGLRCPRLPLLLCLLFLMGVVTLAIMKAPTDSLVSVSALLPVLRSEVLQSLGAPHASYQADVACFQLTDVMRGKVTLKQDDPKLIQRIRTHYLDPPSNEPYNLKVGDDPSQGQSAAIMEILGDFRDGFFIECGALDGETRSNSLVFEKKLGWKGLLVEGDPKNYKMVVQKHRKVWTSNACLSTKPFPHSVMFEQRFNLGKINQNVALGTNKAGLAEVQCLPVYSLLVALNVTTVHYFSLDVEGVELEVLQTIPWDKVDIKVRILTCTFLRKRLGIK
ncbi:Methyltransferase FkbM [Trinorchestia longiramus]|nr:Methyltransferase FkbM [Trinorchestia longiramus]